MELMTFLYVLLLIIAVPFAFWIKSKSGQKWLDNL